jgi:hypothetical protein
VGVPRLIEFGLFLHFSRQIRKNFQLMGNQHGNLINRRKSNYVIKKQSLFLNPLMILKMKMKKMKKKIWNMG